MSTHFDFLVSVSSTFKIIAAIGTFLLIAASPEVVIAHTNNAWLIVSGQALVKESADPVPLNLPAADHLLAKEYPAEQELSFKFVPKILLGKEPAANSVLTWDFGDSGSATGLEVKHRYAKSGSYIVKMTLRSGTEELAEEIIGLNVGPNRLSAPQINYNGKGIAKTELKVSRNQVYKFELANPDSTYKYTWDLGEQGLKTGNSVELSFRSTKLPSYIFLRAEKDGYYKDAWVRINSDEPPAVEVVRPADTDVNPSHTSTTAAEDAAPLVLALGIVGALLIMATSLIILRRKR
jgi:hypothetical protein